MMCNGSRCDGNASRLCFGAGAIITNWATSQTALSATVASQVSAITRGQSATNARVKSARAAVRAARCAPTARKACRKCAIGRGQLCTGKDGLSFVIFRRHACAVRRPCPSTRRQLCGKSRQAAATHWPMRWTSSGMLDPE